MSRPFRPVSGPFRIGIDTGGTFTDVVAIDEATGEILNTKTPSTPRDRSVGVVDGIERSGILNVDIEGMTLVAAVVCFVVAWRTGSAAAGIGAAIGTAGAMALVLAYYAISLRGGAASRPEPSMIGMRA